MKLVGQRTGARTSSSGLLQLHRPLEDKPMAGEKNGHVRHILQKIEKHESLAGVDLRNLYLSGMDLSNLDLRGANFRGCRLSHGKLAASDLTNADLTDTMLINASFKKANLVGTVFRGAIVVGADFSEAKGLNTELIRFLKAKGATGL
jgi:uncharacterized protein YjbI with pentapeptide repeats